MPFLERRLKRTEPATWAASIARNESADIYKNSRQTCSNPDCDASRLFLWKSKRRPIFEEQWGCSTACLQSIIRASVQRERGNANALSLDTHRHRMPLGLVMLSQGLITHAQHQEALALQRANSPRRIGDWLRTDCGLDTASITRGLAAQWNCPVLSLEGFTPAAMALSMPRLFLEEFDLLPLRVAASSILYLGLKNRTNSAAAFSLGKMTNLRVESGLVEESAFDSAKQRLLENPSVPTRYVTVTDTDSLVAKAAAVLEQSQPRGARLVRLHQYYWMRTWLESGSWSGIGMLPPNTEDVTDTVFTIGSIA